MLILSTRNAIRTVQPDGSNVAVLTSKVLLVKYYDIPMS
jgi:hypothetical protein